MDIHADLKQKKSVKTWWDVLLKTPQPHLILLPIVGFMGGILTYFSLSLEPSFLFLLALFLSAVAGVLWYRYTKLSCLLARIFLLFTGGLLLCALHTMNTQTIFLSKTLTNAVVEGKISDIQPQLHRYKVILTDLKIKGVPLQKTPQKAQITISSFILQHPSELAQSKQAHVGDTIRGQAFILKAPSVSLAPDGYYQARDFWFEGVGAIGSISSAQIIQVNSKDSSSIIQKMRFYLQTHLKPLFSSDVNGVVQALVLGDARQLTSPVRALYRTLGLSHILSVSGFHISLIAFLIFAFLRYLFVWLPVSGKTFFFKQLAGVLALSGALLYVLLSGAQPPAVRAFIMVAFVFLCLFIDRRSLSLYAVAVAAFLILCFKPILLLNAGFQLSFIAVLCLVVLVQEGTQLLKNRFWRHRFLVFIAGLFLLNIFVTLATIPFVLYHFHQFALYSIVGNLMLSFIFSIAILPLLVLGVILLPFSQSHFILKGVSFLIEQVHQAGEHIAALPHSMLYFPAFSGWGLVVFTIGFLWLCLLQGKIRFVGFVFILLFPLSFLTSPKPDIFIGQSGRVFAVRNEKGELQLSESFRHRFVTDQWLSMNGQHPALYQENKRFYPDVVFIQGQKIAFSADSCQGASLTIALKKGDYQYCSSLLYSKQDLADNTPLFVFVTKKGVRVLSGISQDSYRPWGFSKKTD